MSDLTPFIRDVKARVPLSRVVEPHVDLVRRGSAIKGCCPFHSEKTPSFNVNDAEGFYHCFGCGAGGDAIKFLQEIEGLTFIEALRQMADLAGMRMPELRKMSGEERARQKQRASKKERIFDLHRAARDYFVEQFHKNIEAQEYAHERGLSAETIAYFEIGFAPDGWQNLLGHLKKTENSPPQLVAEGGLASHSEKKGRFYDRFRKRLIFPICDAAGKPIAFGGRVISKEDEPKYYNSPDSPIYDKSATLYGLHLAKGAIRQSRQVLLLEGYMDVVAVKQAGFENAVASCGTALTRPQASQLKRLADRVYFLYDGDDAGRKAMLRGTLELLQEGLEVRVIQLPPEHDPDSFVAENGADALREEIDNAPDFFEAFLGQMLSKYDPRSANGRQKIADGLLDIVAAVKQPVARANYLGRLAEIAQVNPKTFEQDIRRRSARLAQQETGPRQDFPAQEGHRRAPRKTNYQKSSPGAELPPQSADQHYDQYDEGDRIENFAEINPEGLQDIPANERAIIRLALQRPDLRSEITQRHCANYITDRAGQKMLMALLESELGAAALLDELADGEPPIYWEGMPSPDNLAAWIRETMTWRAEEFDAAPPEETLDFLMRSVTKQFHLRRKKDGYGRIRAGFEDSQEVREKNFDPAAREYYRAAGEYYGGPRRQRDATTPKGDPANK